MARRDYEGHSVETEITAQVNPTDLSISLNSATGWPTGGANGEFFITINPDQVNEERVLVASRSGTTLTVANTGKRGLDGTSAGTHAANSIIRHSYSAVDADEANQHVNDTTQDNHTQYLNNARHDISGRHIYGAALGTRPTPIATGTSLQAGTGAAPSAGDHQHTIGVGSINASNMFAAGVVDAAAIGADTVGTSEIAPLAVTSAELAASAVIAGKIAAAAIDDFSLFSTDTQPWIICTAATRPGSPFEGQFIYETDTNRIYHYTGAAWYYLCGGLNPTSARAYASASTTLSAGAFTTVALASETYDRGNNFASNTYTCPDTRDYDCRGRVNGDGNNAGQEVYAAIYVNGVRRAVGSGIMVRSGLFSDNHASVVTDVLSMTAGDLVTLRAFNSGGNDIGITTGETETYLTIRGV